MLPPPQILCDILVKIENDGTKNHKTDKDCLLQIFKCLKPNLYGKFVRKGESTVLDSFPEDKDLFVMLSGGLGSTNSLWRVLNSMRDPSIVYVEGLFPPDIDSSRKKCVKTLAIEARSSTGGPLASGPPWKTWLTTYKAPRGAEKLSRKARIAVIIASLHQCLEGKNLPVLVWGSVGDCIDILEATSSWGFTHVVPIIEREKIIFSLAEAESISLMFKEKHGVSDRELSPGACLSPIVTNLVCSCWAAHEGTLTPSRGQSGNHKPFANMCGKCKGCDRWLKAWKNVCKVVPGIIVGRRGQVDRDDDRHWSKLPTLRVEGKFKRNFDEWIKEKEEKITKSRLKKKQKKAAASTLDDEEEEEEDDEEKKDEEEVIIEEEEDLDEEELEFMEELNLEEEDEFEEQVDVDIGEEGFASDGGYDSDAGASKKKRKKKTKTKVNKLR
jgi:hypothetical protein